MTGAEAGALPYGRWTSAAGLVPIRQWPGSAKGVLSATLEDETGVINIPVWPTLFEKQRSVVLGSGLLAVDGKSSARAMSSISLPALVRSDI